jgi:Mn-dependent DtxR family transcriptional regulator
MARVLDKKYSVRILGRIENEGPVIISRLADRMDASHATVIRRAEQMYKEQLVKMAPAGKGTQASVKYDTTDLEVCKLAGELVEEYDA